METPTTQTLLDYMGGPGRLGTKDYHLAGLPTLFPGVSFRMFTTDGVELARRVIGDYPVTRILVRQSDPKFMARAWDNGGIQFWEIRPRAEEGLDLFCWADLPFESDQLHWEPLPEEITLAEALLDDGGVFSIEVESNVAMLPCER